MAKRKKIFLTGGTGFIGAYLVDALLKLGHDIASFDAYLNFIENTVYYQTCLKIRKKLFKKPSKTYTGDIRDFQRLEKAIKDFKPDIIVHLAALPMARFHSNFRKDLVTINMYGTFNVLQAFEESSSATKFVYTSSSMAYGHFKKVPQPEDSILNPENQYGAVKAACEYFVKLLPKEVVIIRPTTVYGFTDCANRVTQLLLDAAHLKRPAWVVKGEALDFSYIDDVVDGFLKCILSKEAIGETFNISRGEAREVVDYAEIIKKYFPDFDYEIRKPSNYQVWRGPMDNSKARKILKFKPKYDIEEGIKKTLELIKEFNFYKDL